MGCGASTVAPTADAGGGTSLTRQLTAAIDRTSKSTRVSTLQREAIEEADALLPEYMRLGVAVEWLREFVREHKIEKETTREVSLKMSAALAEGAELANIEAVEHLAAHPAGSGREQAQRGDRQGDDGRAHRRRQTRIDGRRVVKAARRRLEIKNRI